MKTNKSIRQKYYHLWTDENYISRTTEQYFTDFALIQYSNPTPEYHYQALPVVKGSEFAILPPGWESDFHPTPSPQWVITLSGQWSTTTKDGVSITYQPGDVHFGGDLPIEELPLNQQGHRAFNPSTNEPAKVLIISVNTPLSPPQNRDSP
ncbi:hypothetical protein ACJJID_03045 [Microbulbifer sp. CnH-101-G]|uniref:hypothetical protein n=1 Tax=Microbulbifer sp. CnH-101-G TaxID=3243393 RepID=UPI00403A33AC